MRKTYIHSIGAALAAAFILISGALRAEGPRSPDAQHAAAEQGELGKGSLLVASKNIKDPLFGESVVLLLNYDRRGALGLIVNKPTAIQISKILPESSRQPEKDDVVFIGGPVERDQIMLLIQTASPPEGAAHLFGNVYLSSSEEVLRRMHENPLPAERFRLFSGYAGWAPGQLEHEIARGDWSIMPATAELVFDHDPSGLWYRLIHRSLILEARARL